MNERKRGTTATVAERVSIVYTMLLDGYTRPQILREGKAWDVCDRTIDDYIAKAKEELKELNLTELEDNRSLALANLWDLYRTAKQRSEIETCRKILGDIAKIQGLIEHQINHTVSERPLQNVPSAELLKIADKHNGGKH